MRQVSKVQRHPSLAPRPPGRFSGRVVLLVEDEPAQRWLFASALRELGLVVIEAANGEEALRKSHEIEHVDLVVTDIRMPVMDGLELVDRLRHQFHDLTVLFVTGYHVESLASAHTFVMQKPFTHDALLRRVDDILRTGAPAVH